MGGIGNAIVSAMVSYKGNFRFSTGLGDGLIVGDSFMPVLGFITPGNPGGMIWVGKTDDQAILLQMLIARQQKKTKVFLKDVDDRRKAIEELRNLAISKEPFFTSIAIQKNVYGKRTEVHILRDQLAKLTSPPQQDGYLNQRMWVLDFTFTSPLILHGNGEGHDFKTI